MPKPKKNNAHIKPTDGRKHNKGVQKRSRSAGKLTPAKLNKAKRSRMELYSLNAIRKEFGSEEMFYEWLAQKSRKSNYHLGKLMDYAFGDPRDIDRANLKEETKPPTIKFIQNNNGTNTRLLLSLYRTITEQTQSIL